MKLSEIQGDRTLDVVADLIEPIANIAEAGIAADLFKREKLPDGETAKGFLAKRIKKALPKLLKEHKKDLISIMAALDGTSAVEYSASLNMVKLMGDVIDLLTDDVFIGLFSSAQIGNSSGSAPASM